jgi:hypothetical protein
MADCSARRSGCPAGWVTSGEPERTAAERRRASALLNLSLSQAPVPGVTQRAYGRRQPITPRRDRRDRPIDAPVRAGHAIDVGSHGRMTANDQGRVSTLCRNPSYLGLLVGVAGLDPAASSSRSQVLAGTASRAALLAWDRPSMSVRWRPPVSMVIVTHLVTRSLASRYRDRLSWRPCTGMDLAQAPSRLQEP